MRNLMYEYSTRKRMAKLGFTSSIDKVPAIKIGMFMVIEDELGRIEKREANKKKTRKGR